MTTENDDALRAKMDRAARMLEIADGPGGLFELCAEVRVAYLQTIVDSRPDDTKGREAMYHQLKAHDRIVTVMKDVIREGKNAAQYAEQMRKKQEKRAHVA